MRTLRIIGGSLRGRKIKLPENFFSNKTMRPTLDRIRETLFNWLANDVADANCLDLFAGSGALGFEALSRGAKHVSFIDQQPEVLATLKHNVQQLAVNNATMLKGNFPAAMPSLSKAPFDLVFLDPPFQQGLVQQALAWLLAHNYLADDALIYVEAEKALGPVSLDEFAVLRYKETATLSYQLLSHQNTKT